MSMVTARLSMAVYLLLQSNAVLATFPSARGDISRPECIDAMVLAKEMFHSTARRLYAPLTIPKNFKSTLVLGTSELELYGGNSLTSTEDFEKLPQHGGNIHWEKEASGFLRLVVDEAVHSWRGDIYALYLLDDGVSKSDFLSSRHTAASVQYQPVVQFAWRPPLVFSHPQLKPKWFIDVGQPWAFLSDWHVYSSKEGRVVCTISFRPPGKDAGKSLPVSVRKFARKLDEVLGPGNEEGTLQSTARIRNDVQHVLANAALRPWALIDRDVYNSRSEVDAGLKDWAKINSSRRRLYNEILEDYLVAERSLAAYYARGFGLQPLKAQKFAAWSLDLVYRSFFVFPRREANFDSDGLSTNPWPLEH